MFSDPKTTLTALVTAAAYLVAVFGFDLPVTVQTAIVTIGVFLVGLFGKDANTDKQ